MAAVEFYKGLVLEENKLPNSKSIQPYKIKKLFKT
tara:strand:- start:2345 stop:2449 length:105 start_codon:yes stop_codon:yes gene_type:complete